jgi:hypothetical protein
VPRARDDHRGGAAAAGSSLVLTIALAERKIAELQADIDAHRSLSQSLTFDD